MENKYKELDLLKSEYDETSKWIHQLLLHLEKLLNYSTLIFGAIVAYGFAKKNNTFTVYYPLAIFLVYFYTLYYVNQIHALGGYKKFLEEKLNIIIKESFNDQTQNLFIWEKFARKNFQLNIYNSIQGIIYLFILGIFIFLAFSSASGSFQFIVCLLYIFLFIILLISFFATSKMFNKTYNYYHDNNSKEKSKNYS